MNGTSFLNIRCPCADKKIHKLEKLLRNFSFSTTSSLHFWPFTCMFLLKWFLIKNCVDLFHQSTLICYTLEAASMKHIMPRVVWKKFNFLT